MGAAGDDRGRELAERIVKAIGDPGAVIGNRDWGSDERLIDWQTRAVLSVLPALAAPAETEAEKAPLLAAVHRLGGQGRIRAFERSEDGRWFPACLRHWEDPFSDDLGTFETGDAAQLSLVPHILRWHPEWLTDAERLAATPPAPEGEAGRCPDVRTGARCVMWLGHDGQHQNRSGWQWTNPATAGPHTAGGER